VLRMPDAGARALRRRRRDDRGAAAVEFALVVPVLVLFMFGIIQAGFFFAQSASLANGAREGARAGVVKTLGTPRDCASIVSQARLGARTIGMRETQVAVTVRRGTMPSPICSASAGQVAPTTGGTTAPCGGAGVNEALHVQTSFPTKLPLVGTAITLEGEGTYRCEYS